MDHSNNGKSPGMLVAPQRNNYFYGKLMDTHHFQMEQDYGKRKRWMLNRLGLGAGVLCGLNVTSKDGQICVSPGVAIDALGREIIVPEAVCTDPWELTDDCGRPADKLSDNEEHTVYICIAYHECVTDYMPVLVTDCNTREQCSPGTIVESFHLLVRAEKPEGAPETPKPELCDALIADGAEAEKRRLLCEALAADTCPAPTKKPCVVLATVKLLAERKVEEIQPCSRTMVYSNARLLDLILCLATRGAGVSVKTADAETIPAEQPAEASFNPPTGNIHFKIPKGETGPPGPGLDSDLTKIIHINWDHDGYMSLGAFMEGLQIRFSRPINSNILPKAGRMWFIVKAEFSSTLYPYIFPTCFLERTIKIINADTAFYQPQTRIRDILDDALNNAAVGELLFRVIVKCNYLRDENSGMIDGNFFGEAANRDVNTGDRVPGGDFESWFALKRE